MKKKIVYISGSDAFDVNDVRAAFDEVRSTLNLGSDTVLFGVPVDESESLGVESVSPYVPTESSPKVTQNESPEPVIAQEQPNETVVPILSVLASKAVDEIDAVDVAPIAIDSDDKIADEVEIAELADAEIDKPSITDDTDITDMLDSDAPVDSHEKTLEELLETMEPLREDVHVTVESIEPVQNDPEQSDSAPADDVDVTLENLASEFVKNEDKMPTAKKTSERGKIGRLKNILPFKKMKKDDSGLMGDLFGWAGIAANDEDFSIPGFFTNAASKK